MYHLLTITGTALKSDDCPQVALSGIVIRRILVALSIYSTSTLPIEAADFTLGTRGDVVVMKGNIAKGDFEKFRRFIDENDFAKSIYLASPGGNVSEAVKIGRLVRTLKMETIIPGYDPSIKDLLIPSYMKKVNDMCASACFLIFVAGIHRIKYLTIENETTLLGIHRPFLTDDDLMSRSADDAIDSATRLRSFIENYLKEMDVPSKYVELMYSVPKDEIRWVTGPEFKLDLEGFIPELKDWVNAQCIKQAQIDKIINDLVSDETSHELVKNKAKSQDKQPNKTEIYVPFNNIDKREFCEANLLFHLNADARSIYWKSQNAAIRSSVIWRWVILAIILGSAVFGIVRGAKNQSIVNAIVSLFVPFYGIGYWFVGKRN
jgi:hypothetical protein